MEKSEHRLQTSSEVKWAGLGNWLDTGDDEEWLVRKVYIWDLHHSQDIGDFY